MWRRTDLDAGQVAICSCDPDIFLVGHCFIEAIAIILRKLRSHPEKEILVKNGGGVAVRENDERVLNLRKICWAESSQFGSSSLSLVPRSAVRDGGGGGGPSASPRWFVHLQEINE